MTAGENTYAQQQAKVLNPDNFSSLLAAFDCRYPEFKSLPALTALGQTLSYEQVHEQIMKLASYLQNDLGLKAGERIAIQLPNLIQYPIAAWAAWRAGLILVNTNPLYTPTELKHQFNDSGASALIVLADLLPVAKQVLAETGIKTIIATHATDVIQAKKVDSPDLSIHSWIDFQNTDSSRFKAVSLNFNDTAVLQYTGGTTGVAKGAELTHSNLYCAIRQGRTAMQQMEDQRAGRQEISIAPMPLYHVYGFALNVVSLFITGGHSVLIPNPRDIDSLITAMKQHPFTGFAGVNTLFAALLMHPEFDQVDFSHLDTTISGGAAMAVELAEQWQRRTGKQIYEGYGLSETCATATVNRQESNILGTVGLPNPSMRVKIIDDTGNEVAAGDEGELCLQGPNVMKGYWQRPQATAEAIDADGWFKTGDVAILTKEGHVKIVDRLKDMILVSGFNVYPNEIENIVYQLSGVLECAAIGVADEKSGEVVKLFVACANDKIDTAAIEAHCREHLAAYKVPKQIEFRKELPKSNVGKILRRELRA